MIFYDPTEATPSTRLPPSFLSISRPVSRLEYHTGADFLISPYDDPLPEKLLDIPPHRLALERHCQAGILVQRKTGGDFFSSIPRLAEIEARMTVWSVNPWLLVTDVAEHEGQFYVDDRRMTRWKWSHASGAIDAWMDRGGSVRMLPTGNMITEWAKQRERKCKEWLAYPDKVVSHKVPRQTISAEKATWYNTRDAWPVGIGPKALKLLAVYISETWGRPPTLANAVALACSDTVLDIKGWGKKSLAKVRAWWGIDTSNIPPRWGVSSGCWLFDAKCPELGSIKTVQVDVSVENGSQLVVDGQRYEVVKVGLGDGQWKEANQPDFSEAEGVLKQGIILKQV